MVAQSEPQHLSHTPKIIVCTGADQSHDALLTDLVSSLDQVRSDRFDIGVIRFQHEDMRFDYGNERVNIRDVFSHLPRGGIFGYFAARLSVKSSLPELYPGYDFYIWMDADCWVQNNDFVDVLVNGARIADLCLHPEYDIHYTHHQTPNSRTVRLYNTLYDPDDRGLMCFPMINSGVFCAHRSSRLWKSWDEEMKRLIQKHRENKGIYYSDQIPLHKLIYSRALNYSPLRAIFNWQCYACQPHLSVAQRALVVPTAPGEIISILHLAGASKHERLRLPQLDYDFTLRYRDVRRVLKDLTGERG